MYVVLLTTYVVAYNEKFALDQTHIVSNFKVQPNNLVFKPSTHKFLVKFTGGTSVSDVNKHVIQPKQHNFTSFDDIITRKFPKDMIIGNMISLPSISCHLIIMFYCLTFHIYICHSNIIGIVESIGYAQTHSGSKKLHVNLVLKDARQVFPN